MRAFVAMPFSKTFDAYWDCIREVCKVNNLETFRVDKNLSFERSIDVAIRKEISHSELMIAILTGDQNRLIPNPNVAYEIGFAQGIGKEVILLAESVDCLPFDFKQQRTCIYNQDVETFRTLLSQEIGLLRPKLEKDNQQRLKNFFGEIRRCLEIILPAEYRLFKDGIGFQDNCLWYGIHYFQEKYFLSYTVNCGEDLSSIELQVWLSDDEIRADQKAFVKKYYDHLRDQFGFNVTLMLEDRRDMLPINMASIKSMLIEHMNLETRNPSTKEALTIALRLRTFVKTLQPIFLEYAKEKNIKLTMV